MNQDPYNNFNRNNGEDATFGASPDATPNASPTAPASNGYTAEWNSASGGGQTAPAANGYTAEWNARMNPSAQPQPPSVPPFSASSSPNPNPAGNHSPYQSAPFGETQTTRVVFGSGQPESSYHTGQFQASGLGAQTAHQTASYPTPPYGMFPDPTGSFDRVSPAQNQPKQKYASRASVVVALILAVLLSLGCGIGGVIIGTMLTGDGQTSILPSGDGGININHYTSDYSAELDTDGTVASVAQKVSPAVVEIFTDTVTYSEYFGQQITSGAGSGVIITKDGYIITCAHVIDGATKITVRLNDGKDYTAKAIGADNQTDVAVIKIEGTEDFPFVGFGTSNNLVVGQPVIAIGNPLGSLGGTVTTGIISATNREIEIEGQIYNLLQTNAAINSGNSGGGLFDMNGHLIGIVNAKSSGTSIEGLGFAIPSDQAEEIATQLMAYGYVKGRPMIGVSLFEIRNQQDIMNHFQYSRYITDYGLYVAESEHEALNPGDRIVAFAGTEIDSMAALQMALSDKKVGDTVEITVSRLNGRRSELITVSITLRERTAED